MVLHAISTGSPTSVLLDVSGMKCGGCSGSVRRILEGHPSVSSAAVNLLTGTALVQGAGSSDAAALRHETAKLLTEAGFPTRARLECEPASSLPSGVLDADRLETELAARCDARGVQWGLGGVVM